MKKSQKPHLRQEMERSKLPVTSQNPWYAANFTDSLTSQATANWISGRSADLYQDAAFKFAWSFFELFLMAISIKIGQVPHCCGYLVGYLHE